MENLVKKASDIVEEANKSGRKEEAFQKISMGIAFAGLIVGMSEGKERVNAVDSVMDTTIKILMEDGFVVRGRPREFEAKFRIIQLRTMLEPINSAEDLDKIIREEFDKRIWNVCLFDEKVTP